MSLLMVGHNFHICLPLTFHFPFKLPICLPLSVPCGFRVPEPFPFNILF